MLSPGSHCGFKQRVTSMLLKGHVTAVWTNRLREAKNGCRGGDR